MSFEFLTWLHTGAWLAPFIGIGAFGTALWLGWRFFSGRPKVEQTPEALFESHFLSGVSRDRRRAPRRAGHPIEVTLNDGSGREPLRGMVLDRSIGGLGLLVDVAVPVGATFKVKAAEASKTTACVEVTVRFVRPHGAQHELGCQFHRVPSWNELLQFG